MKEARSKPHSPSIEKHQKESFWQITLPLVICSLITLGLAIWIIYAAALGNQIGKTADISLIILIIPAMILFLIPLAILVGLTYSVIWLNKNTSNFMVRLQDFLYQINDAAKKASDKAVKPLINLKSRIALFQAFKRKQ